MKGTEHRTAAFEGMDGRLNGEDAAQAASCARSLKTLLALVGFLASKKNRKKDFVMQGKYYKN